ncbi:MAG TPA: DUF4375 domain-containing protein [Usitatibacter sp.]|nr:DUF4375 domain-containing protein [Usitatibacter sp.]
MKALSPADFLRRILSRPPAGPDAGWDDDRARFEMLVIEATRVGYMRAAERIVEDLRAAGFVLEMKPVGQQQSWREWNIRLDDPRHTAALTIHANRHFRSVQLTYAPAPKKVRRTRAHRLQEAFYARYNGIWDRLRAKPGARLGAMDQILRRVGDFDADVNNGGFGQYLLNKGRREAQRALAALLAIGAVRTARMLEKALGHPEDEDALQELDARFYKSREDLAALAARHAGLG